MNRRTWGARGAALIAATAALSLAGATAASAHHCYKEEWQDAAYAQLSKGRTAWMPLSEMGRMVIAEEFDRPECAQYLTSDDLSEWLEAQGLNQEPLIQSRATVGGGLYYRTGTGPRPFGYLDEEDFEDLTGLLQAAVMECDEASA